MRRLACWLSILLPALAVVAGVSWGSFPLGVPGESSASPDEWIWERVASPEPLWMSLGTLLVAAALYLGFVWIGARRVEHSGRTGTAAWILGLVLCGFTWLWFVQEAAPDNYQLSKAVWVLYFRGSSGYFSEANDKAGDLVSYLATYEQKMAAGDVLHIGTHPPGLTVAMRGLLGLCRASPAFVDAVLATRSDSVGAAFNAFDSTSLRSQPLSTVERAVLWLAALLVQACAALTIVPLYGLLRLTCSRRASWMAAAFWPTAPALAVFLPKADCLYPLLATAFLWLWLTALIRRSGLIAVLAGFVLWLSLTLSLAFLPIALIALLTGCWAVARQPREMLIGNTSNKSAAAGVPRLGLAAHVATCGRRLIPTAGWTMLGFAVPCLATGWFLKLNLLRVWWLNFGNHARFYDQYHRTYWKWLLVNPLELAVAAGTPLVVLAIWSLAGSRRRTDARPLVGHDWCWLAVLGLLWLSGKNMGEVARLWILLMPFLVWSAGPLFEGRHPLRSPSSPEPQPHATFPPSPFSSRIGWCIALAVQLVTAAAIVTQVAGFHYPITRS